MERTQLTMVILDLVTQDMVDMVIQDMVDMVMDILMVNNIVTVNLLLENL